jgi:hypothetical protein
VKVDRWDETAANERLKRAGFANVWQYLLQKPELTVVELAEKIGVAPILIPRMATEVCLATSQMGAFLRDLCAREIRERFPNGWNSAQELRLSSLAIKPQPYKALFLEMGTQIRNQDPPAGWRPANFNDLILLEAYERALASLSDEQRRAIARNEIMRQPGELFREKLRELHTAISVYESPKEFLEQFARVPAFLGNLFAANFCQLEIRNGGIHQFFFSPAGVLAPEAAAGLIAMEMPECAALLKDAIAMLGDPYPRIRRERNERLRALYTKTNRDPFRPLDDRFYELIATELGGFERAADRYTIESDGKKTTTAYEAPRKEAGKS